MYGAMLLGTVNLATRILIAKVNCPCAKYPGANPPDYVAAHYYCKSGSAGPTSLATLYGSDPLWDGRGCVAGDDCCSTLGAPWFYYHFTEPEGGAVKRESVMMRSTLMKLLYWNKYNCTFNKSYIIHVATY